MTKGERTRQHIIEAAAPAFNRNGFKGCSMSDIMEATGLEKGGIYRHFENKEELAVEVLRASLQRSSKLHPPDIDLLPKAKEKVLFMIDHFVESPSNTAGGCPLMNAAVDSDDGTPALRKVVRRAFCDWHGRLETMLQEGQSNGEFLPSAKPNQLADTIIAALEGAQVIARVRGSSEPMKSAQAVLHLLIESVSTSQQ